MSKSKLLIVDDDEGSPRIGTAPSPHFGPSTPSLVSLDLGLPSPRRP